MAEEINYIVRVLGKDLDGTKSILEGVQGIKGIGKRLGDVITSEFCGEVSCHKTKKLGNLDKEEVKKLEEIISNPEKRGLPKWALNRQKDYDTGENKHLTMNDLDFQLRNDFQRLAEIKSYRGLRHMWGLTVRGQKTRGTHRTKGKTTGEKIKKK